MVVGLALPCPWPQGLDALMPPRSERQDLGSYSVVMSLPFPRAGSISLSVEHRGWGPLREHTPSIL